MTDAQLLPQGVTNKMKRGWITASVLSAITLGLVVVSSAHRPDPVCNGKKAGEWIRILSATPPPRRGDPFQEKGGTVISKSLNLEEQTTLTLSREEARHPLKEADSINVNELAPGVDYQEPPAKVALRILGTNALPALVRALRSSDKKVSNTAAEVLGDLGVANGEAVGALVTILRTRESPIHKLYRVAWEKMPGVVGRRLPKPQVPQLVSQFQSDYWSRMSAPACGALDRLAARARNRLEHPVDRQFWNPHDDWIASGVRPHSQAGNATLMATILDAMPEFIAAVKDRDDKVSLSAIVRLGRLGPEAAEAVPTLIQELQNRRRDSVVRQCAATMLAEIGPERIDVTEALMATASGGDRLLRCASVAALGKSGPAGKAAVPLLKRISKSGDKVLECLAYDSLAEIDPEGMKYERPPEPVQSPGPHIYYFMNATNDVELIQRFRRGL